MKPKTKSELMAEWASQPSQLKKEREVKAVRLSTTGSAVKLKSSASSWQWKG